MLVEHPRGEVLDDDVGGGDQSVEHVAAGGALQVQRQAALVGVQPREDRRTLPPLVLGDRDTGDQPGAVRVAGRLDVDDVGTQHRQQVGAARPGPEGGHVDHPHPVERQSRVPRNSIPGCCGAGIATRNAIPRAVGLGVLAEARRRFRRPKRRRRHAVRVRRLGEAVARVGDERAARHEVVQRVDVGAVGDRRVGDAERRGQVPDLVDGLVGHPRIELVGLSRWPAAVIDSGESSSIHSWCPVIAHRSNHCWAVPHPMSTSPSLARAMPGTVSRRASRHGLPSISK